MQIQLSDHFDYKKLFRFVLPSVLMMVFISIYGVVDGFFVSNFVGKTPFAAINLIMPFIMVLGGMGFMIGSGGTALVSKVLGEGDTERANRYFTMMIYLTIALGGLLTLIGIVFIRPISYFLGATEEMIGDCVLYGRIVIGFTVTFMLQNLFQNFLVAAERPKLGLVATLAAGFTNMILDALFIAVFSWGVAGAAMATGISQLVGAVIPFIYFLGKKDRPLRIVRTLPEWRPMLKACVNGSSELMSNISSSVIGMLYNFQLMKFLGEDGVSAYGVIMYVQFIFIALYIGYVVGIAPLIGYNYGAGNKEELQNIFGKSILIISVSGVTLTALALVASMPLAKIFVGYDAVLCDITVGAFRLFSVSFLLAGFNIFTSSLFTALNNGLISAIVSFARTLVFQMLSILILPMIFDVDGIWIATPVAELISLVVSLIFVLAYAKTYRYIRPRQKNNKIKQ
ncbi:MAG: MATE family efflux transporter [Ruminococcaceae bacterium]|nr:MATE family efflux transporter [Oscillospiraceae bacterium]